MSEPQLEFTGERFTPECVREIWYEHVHRYAFAASLAAGKRVLDAACGEGYGSALLASRAAFVQGVDLSAKAVAHARERYGELSNLAFSEADVTALADQAQGPFDLIVSFETLEHVESQESMLDGFAERLAPDGILLISTPDKRVYSDLTGHANEFHVRELYREEFQEMLGRRFAALRMLGHKLLFQSVIWDAERDGHWSATTHGAQSAGLGYEPVYWIAACSRDPGALKALPSLDLFGDQAESVYRHYDHEVRKNMQAGRRIQELEQEIAALREQLGGNPDEADKESR